MRRSTIQWEVLAKAYKQPYIDVYGSGEYSAAEVLEREGLLTRDMPRSKRFKITDTGKSVHESRMAFR